ncbi:Transcription factor bHLH47 [Acorus calamus]|uniref:Transcription factor bHLH47 n=1 Tax=Acorus calamus TaxID=4465 RepID=A0AAV9E614_ACOCL|nr:Transcription factor bHLH47 [Acorus calamus]
MAVSVTREVDAVSVDPVGRAFSNKNNPGKVPRKIHKAEREKLKRDHLNELFVELGNALELTEPARQNNGKATILGDTTRLLREMLAQVDSLRKENAALLSESHYVTVEKDELKDEKEVLEAEVERLQNELKKRMQSDPSKWTSASDSTHPLSQHVTPTLHQYTQHPQTQPSVVGPVFIIPLSRDPAETHTDMQNPVITPKPPSLVTKPQARYPTPSDSWPPLQLLVSQARVSLEGQASGVGVSASTNVSRRG